MEAKRGSGKVSSNSQECTSHGDLFITVADLKTSNLIKKRAPTRVFSCEFDEILQISYCRTLENCLLQVWKVIRETEYRGHIKYQGVTNSVITLNFCNKNLVHPSLHQNSVKGTVMQIEKALINDRLRVSKIS